MKDLKPTGEVQSGDGWELSHVDTFSAVGIARLKDKVVDHSIGDPPYSEHVETGQAVSGRRTGQAVIRKEKIGVGFLTDRQVVELCTQLVRVTRHWIAMFCAWEQLHLYKAAIGAAGGTYYRACGWEKPDGTPQLNGIGPATWGECLVVAYAAPKVRRKWNAHGKRGLYKRGVCRGAQRTVDEVGETLHPTQKPHGLMVEIIEDFTKPGELILDPFAGVASTLIAARATGRQAMGFELSRKWFECGARRLRGEVAVPNYRQPELFAAFAT